VYVHVVWERCHLVNARIMCACVGEHVKGGEENVLKVQNLLIFSNYTKQ